MSYYWQTTTYCYCGSNSSKHSSCDKETKKPVKQNKQPKLSTDSNTTSVAKESTSTSSCEENEPEVHEEERREAD